MTSRIQFTSRRERRLWIITVAVVVAIYSTLGLNAALAERIGNQRALENLFFWVFIVLLGALTVVALRDRPRGLEIAVLVAVAAVYTMVLLRISLPTERSHIMEYGLVAILFYEALVERKNNGAQVWRPALLAVAISSAIGVLDEVVQLAIPSRVFDVIDIYFNVLASAGAVLALLALRAARRRRLEARAEIDGSF